MHTFIYIHVKSYYGMLSQPSPSWLYGNWCISTNPCTKNGSTHSSSTFNHAWVCPSAPVAINSLWWWPGGYAVLRQYIYVMLILVLYVKLCNSIAYAIYFFCDHEVYTFETSNIFIWHYIKVNNCVVCSLVCISKIWILQVERLIVDNQIGSYINLSFCSYCLKSYQPRVI